MKKFILLLCVVMLFMCFSGFIIDGEKDYDVLFFIYSNEEIDYEIKEHVDGSEMMYIFYKSGHDIKKSIHLLNYGFSEYEIVKTKNEKCIIIMTDLEVVKNTIINIDDEKGLGITTDWLNDPGVPEQN